MHLAEAKTIFMLGIGGTGMRGLAKLLAGTGKTIVGSDQQYEIVKDWDDMKNYEVVAEEDGAKLLEKASLLVYTDAAEEDHRLLMKARELGIPTMAYQEALGEFSKQFRTIAVTGTHGKTSTTAFLAHILQQVGKDPWALVGAMVPTWGGGALVGESDLFVVEADEYREHFLTLEPEHAIVTTVDFDHPDYFRDLEHVQDSYDKFRARVKGRVIEEVEERDVKAPIPGMHMRHNALLAIEMAVELGVSRAEAEEALVSFPGIWRRMEKLGTIERAEIISDYGHHPAELQATLKAQISEHQPWRRLRPASKILVIFEAHTLERLKRFFDGFLEALNLADGVLLVPVFVPAGREDETAEAAATLLEFEKQLGVPTWRIDDFDELEERLKEIVSPFDVAIAFTAGQLDAHLRRLV